MKTFARILLLSLLVGCNSSQPGSLTAAGKSDSGGAAPDFSLVSVDGKTVNLSDFKGKVVLLDFWATWCPPCRMSTPAVVELGKEFEGQDFAVIGISLDEETDNVKPFVEKQNIKHTIVLGANSSVGQDYRVRAIPSFFILDKKGVVIKQYAGYYPGLEKEWEQEINSLLK